MHYKHENITKYGRKLTCTKSRFIGIISAVVDRIAKMVGRHAPSVLTMILGLFTYAI